MSKIRNVPEHINFSAEEEKIQKRWQENNTFQKSLELSKDRPLYTFYDGPPFATGLPHYGHILTGTIKDIVTRWAHQNGRHVVRRFGWDTHGLPVEYEVDTMEKITSPQQVHEMGIGEYNKKCRSIVMRYAEQWQTVVERMGRWIDFDNDYKTLYPWFMESVWWVFSELFKKGLVYRGVKVMPFSTGCSTPLSNFEAGQDYKDTFDPAVHVAFPLVENPNRYLIVWTTTPWTLPSNLAICVHPDLEYAVVKEVQSGREFILLEQRLQDLFKSASEYELVEKLNGKDLKGKQYKPVFAYFAHLAEGGKAFRVLNGTFVTTDQGTGVVHQAPYFGEIDFQTCLDNGVISRDSPMICPVNEKGLFTAPVTDFIGMYVKDADKLIKKYLKDSGNLIKESQIRHSYPFCWRSHTPLLYKAVPSWFIKVESLVDRLLANNAETYWVPENVKEKRFGNWLRDARDWAVSRNRFWGTPINLWVSDDFEEIVCPSSIAELEELTGHKITDIHRENIDHLTIPSKRNKDKVLHRVSEVFDCWFESGSMPYAQQHYPFENAETFEKSFPADFVCEGVDQTRGWFYTLMVLGTALFDRPPFKNLVCSGLILASDGNKMSKSKKNFPDPLEVIHKYGADAVRIYLIDSPVVKGENLKFREEGVQEVLKDVFLPWFHAYRFFVQSAKMYEDHSSKAFAFRDKGFSNVMDKWVLSFTNSLIEDVHREMNAYRLYNVISPLTKYFNVLTNCYVRLNRKRLKGESALDDEDRLLGISTLGHVLLLITTLMSPFTPFFSEYLWDNLKDLVGRTEESVHFTMLPKPESEFIDKVVERRVSAMRVVLDTVRALRERKAISVKYPLKEMVVVHRDQQFLDDLKSLESYILPELNVQSMTLSQDKHKYGVKLKAEPNFKNLSRFRAEQKNVVNYLKSQVTEVELEKFLSEKKLTVLGRELGEDDLKVSFYSDTAQQMTDEKWETANGENSCVVMLNTTKDDELHSQGLAREIVNRIQKLRKTAHLQPSDSAVAYCVLEKGTDLDKAAKDHQAYIEQSGGTRVIYEPPTDGLNVLAFNTSKVKDLEIQLHLHAVLILSDIIGGIYRTPAASAADHPRLRRGPRPKSRISGSHIFLWPSNSGLKPVPIVFSRREEAIGVLHAQIRATTEKFPSIKNVCKHGFVNVSLWNEKYAQESVAFHIWGK
ncbi:tRNA synthetases class I (I, l, M and v) domain-containing protein [Ditylenchus destructor]|uniref:Isoleucine--tRNA ligase, cytoplasmic n=1 Tax=Ditylenchus destructor TaxID=166010 RepID=A0AAD4N9A6_9BILA|nr:tRNA synthetases class I (I, l, M and v) domain-containing protein [Ditylenchus destructor]